MITAESIRQAIWQAHRWRDLLWQAVMDDLAQRNPAAAQAAQAAIQTYPAHLLVGSATRRATLAWPHLDEQARQEWIWVSQFVQHTWIRGYLAADLRDTAS